MVLRPWVPLTSLRMRPILRPLHLECRSRLLCHIQHTVDPNGNPAITKRHVRTWKAFRSSCFALPQLHTAGPCGMRTCLDFLLLRYGHDAFVSQPTWNAFHASFLRNSANSALLLPAASCFSSSG